MCRVWSAPAALFLSMLLAADSVGAATYYTTLPTLQIDADVDVATDICCRREQHFVRVGVDTFGQELIVDVGKCRHHCHHTNGVSKKKFLELMDDYQDTDPIELFLRQWARQASCVAPSRCRPLETVLERHYTPSGAVDSAVTRRCGCQQPAAACQRLSRLVTFHPGTPHQRQIDVGTCGGPCGSASEGDSCHSLRNKTVSIDGPNGAEVVSVIEECICTHGCYRMALMEQVFDYSEPTKPQIKNVDVGQCVGACTKDQRGRDCVYSDPVTSKCLMSLQFQARGCVASGTKEHFYRAENGREKALLSITGCSCH